MEGIRIFNKYHELTSLIMMYGERFPKKHGSWLKLQYINDYYFILDTWNGAISIVKNPKFKYWNKLYGGFYYDEMIKQIAIDFGSFSSFIDEELYDFYIENLKNEILERQA